MDPERDLRYMRRALELARRGYWTTPPNPAVGAVVVAGDEIVGEGYHLRPGAAHAEVVALEAAAWRARHATMYVTLEPCNHHGRTPPCTEAIIDAGVQRVVIASEDPNHRVCGKGIDRLMFAGLEVEVGIACEDALTMNRRHVLAASQRRPLVIAKTARTLDGRTMGPGRTPLAVSGREALAWVGRRRSEVNAVVVGSGTMLSDDPRLSARRTDDSLYERQPQRVIVDGRLRTPPTARIFGEPGGDIVIVTATDMSRSPAAEELQKAGARVFGVQANGTGTPDPRAGLEALNASGIDGVILEGGGRIMADWSARDLIDFWEIVISPAVIGEGGGMIESAFDPPLRLGPIHAEELGIDLLVRAVPAEDEIDTGTQEEKEKPCSAVS